MIVKDFYNELNELYPFSLQDEWDKSGIFKNNFWNDELKVPTLSLDINLSVVEFAIKNNSNLIVSHHPICINDSDLKKPLLKKMIALLDEYRISIISLHTNFDKAKYGMNYQILKKIGCKKIEKSIKSDYIFYGYLDNLGIEKNLAQIKEKLDLDYLHCGKNNFDLLKTKNKKRFKIGVVGGSGSSCVNEIRKKDKCDIFITSEIKWHLFNYYNTIENQLVLIEVPHSIEKIFIETMIKKYKDISFLVFPHTKILTF